MNNVFSPEMLQSVDNELRKHREDMAFRYSRLMIWIPLGGGLMLLILWFFWQEYLQIRTVALTLPLLSIGAALQPYFRSKGQMTAGIIVNLGAFAPGYRRADRSDRSVGFFRTSWHSR